MVAGDYGASCRWKKAPMIVKTENVLQRFHMYVVMIRESKYSFGADSMLGLHFDLIGEQLVACAMM